MNVYDMKEKISKLESWADEHCIPLQQLDKVFSMLELGCREPWDETKPSQYPSCYIQDQFAKPWHDPSNYKWVKLLEENYDVIRNEAVNAMTHNETRIHPDNENFASNGTWETYFLYKNGIPYQEHLVQCPETAKILDQIEGVKLAGRTYFSAMSPGIHIKTHCGPHNFKLRTHLGLVVPDGSIIRVGESKPRPWLEGKCIVFDDSFDHEVWNNGDTVRIVLIVDTWNPTLSNVEVRALSHIMPEFYMKEV